MQQLVEELRFKIRLIKRNIWSNIIFDRKMIDCDIWSRDTWLNVPVIFDYTIVEAGSGAEWSKGFRLELGVWVELGLATKIFGSCSDLDLFFQWLKGTQ